ncbi:MAG TPA: type VI secretion system protein TssA, partial [Anaeromyxobacter sp.]
MTVEYDALKARAEPWLAPIAGASPAGATARFDPEYQSLADEVGKLDMPAGGEVNWKKVVSGAGTMLQKKSKDLVMAAYLSHALHVTQGLGGLVTGLVLLSETMERYWDTMYPEAKRPRGRANALQWFVEKTTNALASASPGSAEDMEGLAAATRHLSQLAREKLGEMCPAFGPMMDPVERLKAAATPPEPSPADQPAPAAPSPAQAPAPAAPEPAFAAPAAPAAAAEAVDFLRNVGSSLSGVAAMLRQADASDPRAYRILRIGLWLHMAGAPPATGGKTQIPAPPEGLRNQLATIAQNQRWPALLEETEAAASQHRFWIDLHRMSWQALSAMGATHERARDAVVSEVRSLLGRMPQLPTLSFGDGTPLADPQTRSWIDEQVLVGSGSAPARGGAAADEAAAEKLAEAKKLLAATQVPEALGLLRDEAAKRNGRKRFLVTADAARLCAGAGLTAIAKSLYEDLDREARAHHLEEWEPELAAECLKGLLASARALAKDPRGSLPDMTEP